MVLKPCKQWDKPTNLNWLAEFLSSTIPIKNGGLFVAILNFQGVWFNTIPTVEFQEENRGMHKWWYQYPRHQIVKKVWLRCPSLGDLGSS